jgi:hypothetical protein
LLFDGLELFLNNFRETPRAEPSKWKAVAIVLKVQGKDFYSSRN